MATQTIKVGGIDITPDFKIIRGLADGGALVFNPNDVNQRVRLNQNSLGSIDEFLTQGGRSSEARVEDFPTLFGKVAGVRNIDEYSAHRDTSKKKLQE